VPRWQTAAQAKGVKKFPPKLGAELS